MYSSKMIMDFKKHWPDAVTMELFEDPEYCLGIMSEPAVFAAIDCRLRETKEIYDRQYAERLRELNTTVVQRWGGRDQWNWLMIALAATGVVVSYKIGKKVFQSTPQGAALTADSQATDVAKQRATLAKQKATIAKQKADASLRESQRKANVSRPGISVGSQSGIVPFDTGRGHFMGVLRPGNKGNELYQRV